MSLHSKLVGHKQWITRCYIQEDCALYAPCIQWAYWNILSVGYKLFIQTFSLVLFHCYWSLLPCFKDASSQLTAWLRENFWSYLFLKIQSYVQHVSLPFILANIFPITQPPRLGSHSYRMKNSCCTCQHSQHLRGYVISAVNAAFIGALPPWAKQHSWAPASLLRVNVLQRLQQQGCSKPCVES